MRYTINGLMIAGGVLLFVFLVQFAAQEWSQKRMLSQVTRDLEVQRTAYPPLPNDSQHTDEPPLHPAVDYAAASHEAFAILAIPRLDKAVAVIAGVDDEDLKKGVGHIPTTAYPGQGEQIVLSGHRDTVFRGIKDLGIGDELVVTMPYDTYSYTIKETEIVPENDTSVIREMGEEVLVVTTCYPFNYVGDAPFRYVYYAYPSEL